MIANYPLDAVEQLTQPPELTQVPPAETLRDIDAQAGDLVDKWHQATQAYAQAVADVYSATGPKGARWQRAVHSDRAKIAAGQDVDPARSAVVTLLQGHDSRIAEAVLASARADHALAELRERVADPSVRGALAAASLRWASAATDRLRAAVVHRSRGELETLREDRDRTWSPMQSLIAWTQNATGQYHAQRYGWPLQVQEVFAADGVVKVLDELVGGIDKDFGSRAITMSMPEGIVPARPDEGRAAGLRNGADRARLSRRERRQQAQQARQ